MNAVKGRGATSSAASSRFNLPARETDGDWLDMAETVDGPSRHPATTVTEEHPRSILSFNASPDVPFDRSVNAYRGCEHVIHHDSIVQYERAMISRIDAFSPFLAL